MSTTPTVSTLLVSTLKDESKDINPQELINRFGWPDYLVFSSMLVASAAIGIYYACSGNKTNTTKELLMGNRAMRTFPVAMSVLASFMSAITLLGTPAEMYLYGTQYWMICLSFILVIPAAAYLYMPIFYNLGLTSAYEYLEKRFNRVIRTMASCVFSFQMMLYMAVVLYAPALALAQVTGLNMWLSVISIGVVCTFYTSIGGIKAVVWTDFFQVIMMFGSIIVIVIKGAHDEGGIQQVWKTSEEGKRIEFFNFSPDPTVRHTVWSLGIGGYFTWLAVYGVNQAMVQRYLTIPTLKGAQKTIWYNLPGLILLVLITGLAGLIVYTKYHDCDPITLKLVNAPDQLFPLYVMDVLGFLPGLPGLFVAGVFSGALSTVSSGVNSLAAVTLEDFIKTYIRNDLSELWAARLTKILALVYGIITIILVVVAKELGNVLQATLSIRGMIGGPLLGVFTLGMFFPWTNNKGAGGGLLTGLSISFWVGFGAFIQKPLIPRAPVSVDGCLGNHTLPTTVAPEIHNAEVFPLYRISYMWFSAIGFFSVLISGLIISFITGPNKPEDIDPKLICPVFDKVCCCLPIRLRKKLRFRVGQNVSILPRDQSIVTTMSSESSADLKKEKNGVLNHSYIPSMTDLEEPEMDNKREKSKNELNAETQITPF
ncbi:sodium-coupled monocarboxylate transporter 2-like isoform X2 [Limulus polyphemus]|nr:sodium-coupled monocarboxylate transporter 2-like isoform X2 [Limulus polyphemus]XP_022258310.1 sodium-coupled monocarboxylate transporter 2-like isoform X2 [Limulus polyphemus]